MPELKSRFHGNRLGSSRHCITPEPLSPPSGSVTRALRRGPEMEGSCPRKEKGTIKLHSFAKGDLSPFYEPTIIGIKKKKEAQCYICRGPLGADERGSWRYSHRGISTELTGSPPSPSLPLLQRQRGPHIAPNPKRFLPNRPCSFSS